ncbi:hypothetical protein DUNSADRAFT_4283 [Dunaliella salina]|uniref:Encoded protein n=1 Tax=Dunaliella salina TaxID=3046 RepID=A0ABQ7GSB2_DUNSA|nr:hypothetical protein DUNSADRAFT_4283 [Dunaliella salina]|eukprot:KAF5837482.1 hypothetical protein DUNSADRAFT_4283 [Dunaliella salina]
MSTFLPGEILKPGTPLPPLPADSVDIIVKWHPRARTTCAPMSTYLPGEIMNPGTPLPPLPADSADITVKGDLEAVPPLTASCSTSPPQQGHFANPFGEILKPYHPLPPLALPVPLNRDILQTPSGRS